MRKATGSGNVRHWLRLIVLGGCAGALFAALFWISDAANALPNSAPQWLRGFQPEASVRNLLAGVVSATIVGVTSVALFGAVYQLIRSRSADRP